MLRYCVFIFSMQDFSQTLNMLPWAVALLMGSNSRAFRTDHRFHLFTELFVGCKASYFEE